MSKREPAEISANLEAHIAEIAEQEGELKGFMARNSFRARMCPKCENLMNDESDGLYCPTCCRTLYEIEREVEAKEERKSFFDY